jgi:hypothetical protein
MPRKAGRAQGGSSARPTSFSSGPGGGARSGGTCTSS